MGFAPRANFRQRRPKRGHPVELRLVAHLTPALVITVLLAPTSIASRRLQMSQRIGCNPNIAVGGWNDEFADAGKSSLITYWATVRAHIAKALAIANTSDARRVIAGVAETRSLGIA